MDIVVFNRTILDTIKAQSNIILILFGLVVINLIIDITWCFVKKEKNAFSIFGLFSAGKNIQTKLSAKDKFSLDLFAFLLLITFSVWRLLPVYLDFSNHSYCEIYTTYVRTADSSDSNMLSYGYVYVMMDGKQVRLELPANWSSEDFPEGEYTGYVCYSERSRYILSFSPDPSVPTAARHGSSRTMPTDFVHPKRTVQQAIPMSTAMES